MIISAPRGRLGPLAPTAIHSIAKVRFLSSGQPSSCVRADPPLRPACGQAWTELSRNQAGKRMSRRSERWIPGIPSTCTAEVTAIGATQYQSRWANTSEGEPWFGNASQARFFHVRTERMNSSLLCLRLRFSFQILLNMHLAKCLSLVSLRTAYRAAHRPGGQYQVRNGCHVVGKNCRTLTAASAARNLEVVRGSNGS